MRWGGGMKLPDDFWDDWRTPADADMTPLGFLAAAFTFGLFFVAVLGVLITLWAAMVPTTVQ